MYKKLLDDAPGLYGDVARYVYGELTTDEPAIALAAALSFIGALKSRRYFVENVHPNIYTCVIAPSGTGKTQAQNAIQNLCRKNGLESLLMGAPASDSGLLRGLSSDSRKLLIWDEFGIALSELSATKQGYRALILSALMALYTASSSIYLGKEYSQQNRTDLKEPALSIFAAATPGRFFKALNTDFIEDGFLSRWILFFGSTENITFKKQKESFYLSKQSIDELLRIQKGKPGNAGNLSCITPAPEAVRFPWKETSGAIFKLECQKKISKPGSELQRVLYSRAWIHALKVWNIITPVGDEDNLDHYHYALTLVDEHIKQTVSRCEAFIEPSDPRMAARKKFYSLIKPGELVSRSELCLRARHLPLARHERNGLIDDQLESELWVCHLQTSPDSRKKTQFFALKK